MALAWSHKPVEQTVSKHFGGLQVPFEGTQTKSNTNSNENSDERQKESSQTLALQQILDEVNSKLMSKKQVTVVNTFWLFFNFDPSCLILITFSAI